MADLLPRVAVALPPPGQALDPRRLFPASLSQVWLEIGFGSGEHLATQAAAHPHVGLIGCEPYVNGVASLLSRMDRDGLANIRVLADDARLLLAALTEASIARAFVLFPDPWPKKRHHKRRLISQATLDALARVLVDGAELRIGLDEPDYIRWTLERFIVHPAFSWPARGPEDWRRRPQDWPSTRYERRAVREGRTCTYLRFQRLGRE